MGKSRTLISPSLIETNSTYTRGRLSFYVYILAGLNVPFCKIFRFFCKDHNKNTIAPDVARHLRKNSILVYIQKKQALDWQVAKNDATNVVHMLPHDIVEWCH